MSDARSKIADFLATSGAQLMRGVRAAKDYTGGPRRMAETAAIDARDGFMHPGEVYAGRADPMDVEKAMGTVGMVGTSSLAGTALKPAGAFGMFGGGRAKFADHAKGKLHDELEAIPGARNNLDAEQGRWARTGWFRGVDGERRFEIPDEPAKLTAAMEARWDGGPDGFMARKDFGDAGGMYSLRDVLDHPELYKNYPHLADLPVMIGDPMLPMNGGVRGSYTKPGNHALFGKTGHIELHGGLEPDEMRSTLLHEIQHAVQNYEGFAPGANGRTVGAENYRRSSGEVEARTVQDRADMGAIEREMYHPMHYSEVPREEQIISRASPVVNRPVTDATPPGLSRVIAALLGPKA
jgi:hypothetical protein